MNLITIHGVRGYVDENGTAQLNLEDISRGLGFTQQKNGIEYIRWETVTGYLSDLGFSQLVGKDGSIPENVFYRLAMKARNEVADVFQAKVADEILPSIRKHGAYMTPETIEKTLHNPDFIIGLATRLKDETARADAATQEKLEFEAQLKEQQPMLAIYNLAISAQNTMSMNEVAKALGTGRTRLYQMLRDEGFIMKGSTLPYQRYVDSGYFKVTERPRASGDTITNDPATRVYAKGFEAIAKMIQRRNLTPST